ncbi:alcohol dehydrogenase catalytic domain-containing protein, partial [Streptomyces caeruleatus]
GHKFVGTIVDKGADVRNLTFAIGDSVVSTSTIQCGTCYYCKLGNSGTCEHTNTFGKPGLDGAQAGYVSILFAQ